MRAIQHRAAPSHAFERASTQRMRGARPISQWVRRVTRTETLGRDAAEAVQGARNPPAGAPTLILPSDVSWGEGGVPGAPLPVPVPAQTTAAAVAQAARALRSGEPALILMSGPRASPRCACHRLHHRRRQLARG